MTEHGPAPVEHPAVGIYLAVMSAIAGIICVITFVLLVGVVKAETGADPWEHTIVNDSYAPLIGVALVSLLVAVLWYNVMRLLVRPFIVRR